MIQKHQQGVSLTHKIHSELKRLNNYFTNEHLKSPTLVTKYYQKQTKPSGNEEIKKQRREDSIRKSYGSIPNHRNNSLYQPTSERSQEANTRVQSGKDGRQVYHSLDKGPIEGFFRQRQESLKQPSTTESQPQMSTIISKQIPNHEPTKCSFKNNGSVRAYAANTNKGLIRNYNEDRVSIILNIMKPLNRSGENWPRCSFFGVYDGHGGVLCAEFLRDNLHQFVVRESCFPMDPREALKKGFMKAEQRFLEMAQSKNEIERSGSCAIVVLVVGDACFVANVGDSRAVMSGDNGKKVYTLSRDHKPNDEEERTRIIAAGGKVYQSQINGNEIQEAILGPHRVFPGRLSVSRTFGDIEAKLPSLGGNQKVVICDPEIRQFSLTKDHDFIILASDGIFDKLNSKESITSSWETLQKTLPTDSHQACGYIVEGVMLEALRRKTHDNITVVVVGLQGLQGYQKETVNKENNTQLNTIQQIQRNKSPYQSKIALQKTPINSINMTSAQNLRSTSSKFELNRMTQNV